jgi:Na+/H+ antiporter NhaC
MSLSFTSIIPPVLVLTLGMLTHRVFFSLLCGIISAGVIAHGPSLAAIKLLLLRLFEASGLHCAGSWCSIKSNDELLLFIFFANLGVIVTLLEFSGGAAAYATALTNRLRSKKQVERTSLFLSLCFFIDDYLSTLSVGTIMRPLTDSFKIPRVKLAYLIDSMAAPLAIMVPISSWIAVILGQFIKAGISSHASADTVITADPFLLYLNTIPFILYSLITVASLFFIVQGRIAFGSMKHHEEIAIATGNMCGGKTPPSRAVSYSIATNGSLIDFFLPITTFLLSVTIGILYTGNHTWLGGSNDIITTLSESNSALALALGSVITVLVAAGSLLLQKKATPQRLPSLLRDGINLMLPAILTLWLAWTLGALLRVLAQTLLGSVPLALFPVMFFVASGVISFALGSSWGAFAITVPIAIPMTLCSAGLAAPIALTQLPILLPVLGAIMSGVVLGDHLSPISDTTIMASTSAGSRHMDHVTTQLGYVLPIFSATCCAFLVAGITSDWGYRISTLSSLTVGVVLSCLLLYAAHHRSTTATSKE